MTMTKNIKKRPVKYDTIFAVVSLLLLKISLQDPPYQPLEIVSIVVFSLLVGMSGTLAMLKCKGLVLRHQLTPEECGEVRSKQIRILIGLIVITIGVFLWNTRLLNGIGRTGSENKLPQFESDPMGVLDRALSEENPLLFVSRSGTWGGMDSDSSILFSTNKVVQLVEYGYAIQAYQGEFQADENGVLKLSFPEYDVHWPEMVLVKDEEGIYLYPYSIENGFIMGGRVGAVETADMNPFWPFKFRPGTSSSLHSITVWRNSALKYFVCPQLPEEFIWEEGKLHFRIDIDIDEEGSTTVRKYFAHYKDTMNVPTDDPQYGKFSDGDWRYFAVEAALEAVKYWKFYPATVNGEPTRSGDSFHFILSKERKSNAPHWIIRETNDFNGWTIYDNMPNLTRQ